MGLGGSLITKGKTCTQTGTKSHFPGNPVIGKVLVAGFFCYPTSERRNMYGIDLAAAVRSDLTRREVAGIIKMLRKYHSESDIFWFRMSLIAEGKYPAK